jgi:hypothetical protein
MKRNTLFLILALMTSVIPAWASSTLGSKSSPAQPSPSPSALSKPYQDFVDACQAAFDSSSQGPDNVGKVICPCTAEESKHQGVTVPELEKETAEIKKTSSYKIRNKKLLAAFHYCTINLMEETEHSQQ